MANPWTPSAGDSLDSTRFNSNWTWIKNLVQGGLDADSLADNAGIAAEQLADRFALIPGGCHVLIPHVIDPNIARAIGTPGSLVNGIECPLVGSSAEQVGELLVDVRSGLPMYLSHVDFYVTAVYEGDSGKWPVIKVYRGDDLLGGAGITLDTNNQWHRLGNSNPHDYPAEALQLNDVLYFKLHSDSTTVEPLIRGLRAYPWYKIQLTH